MNALIAKYVEAYQQEQGTSTEKVKKILMQHAHDWDWADSTSVIADLIDDTNITADDIVDFLANTYEHEGGNDEFHYAVCALQICLRKQQLAEIHALQQEEIELEEKEQDEYDHEFFNLKHHDLFHTMKF